MDRQSLIVSLMFFTLFAVLGWAVYQNYSVRRSQKRAGIDPDSAEAVPQPGSLDARRRREAKSGVH